MGLTESQRKAIAARGNVLVMAGAGTGKTSTLVERALQLIEVERVPLPNILMVTFTDAAAAEIRQRIREEMEKRATSGDNGGWLNEQLASFDVANIGTLHSFCLKLVRQHFYDLGLDPQFSVLSEEEANLLREEALDELLDDQYRGNTEENARVRDLVELYGASSDGRLRQLVQKIHAYAQSLPDPHFWIAAQRTYLSDSEPTQWRHWLLTAIADCIQSAKTSFASAPQENSVAAACMRVLSDLPTDCGLVEARAAFDNIITCFDECPRGKKGKFVNPFERELGHFKFLRSLLPDEGASGPGPLEQDWELMRGPAMTLLTLSEAFGQQYAASKSTAGIIDFQDIEQFALKLLWDLATGSTTATAQQWQRQLQHIFVDEYQDINGAQDQLIRCLSREGNEANRFLVGDVKQSIYRFRLANPYIFQSYAELWKQEGAVIHLQENFRSAPAIIDFVNRLFSVTMTGEFGGVTYDEPAKLIAARKNLPELDGQPPVQLHLRVKPQKSEADSEDCFSEEMQDLDEMEKEARLVCNLLRQAHKSGRLVWDSEQKQNRPMRWSDCVVLMRSPSNKAECYAKEFSRQAIPARIQSADFFTSMETLDLLNALRVIDNPQQDIPLLALMRSPLAGFSCEDLAHIRMAAEGHFWIALQRFHVSARAVTGHAALASKVIQFIKRVDAWRLTAREETACRVLQQILNQTHYEASLMLQDRPAQRQANVQRLLGMARKFDSFQRQGLFRFLRFVKSQEDAEAEPAAPALSAQDAVRLMTIHKSKGLEFPVVVLADLSNCFNEQDLREPLLLDEQYGLCGKIQSAEADAIYPSLPHKLASLRQAKELRGEELRLLYVALTRARDMLFITGSINSKMHDALLNPGGENPRSSSKRFTDWIRQWLLSDGAADLTRGCSQLDPDLAIRFWNDEAIAKLEHVQPLLQPSATAVPLPDFVKVANRVQWTYAHTDSTRTPAKTSVTGLRRALADDEEDTPDAFRAKVWQHASSTQPGSRPGMSAAEVGSAHHKFLQHLRLEHCVSNEALCAEAQRIAADGLLEEAAVAALDLDSIAAFWATAEGKRLQSKGVVLRRELPFTARFGVDEIGLLGGRPPQPLVDGDFVVVQGVVDLLAIFDKELWIIDFKSDNVSGIDVRDRAQSHGLQLRAYAVALQKVFPGYAAKAWLYFIRPRQLEPVPLVIEIKERPQLSGAERQLRLF